jgi:hypothetical protein
LVVEVEVVLQPLAHPPQNPLILGEEEVEVLLLEPLSLDSLEGLEGSAVEEVEVPLLEPQ